MLYVISRIEPKDEDSRRYVVNVANFTKLAKLSKNKLYRELRDLAENLKFKVLVVPNHFDAETGKHVDLVTSWFSDAFITANGQGYFAVEISRNLKPYLLKMKREFFRFQLQQVMQMRSAYAIRLHQFAKRWEFKRRFTVSVVELRGIMGALHPGAARSRRPWPTTPTSSAGRCSRPSRRSTSKVTFSWASPRSRRKRARRSRPW